MSHRAFLRSSGIAGYSGGVANRALHVRGNGSRRQDKVPGRPEPRRSEHQQRPAERGGIGPVRTAERVAQEPDELRSEEHTSELQSQSNLVCRLLLEKKNSDAARAGQWQQTPEHSLTLGMYGSIERFLVSALYGSERTGVTAQFLYAQHPLTRDISS